MENSKIRVAITHGDTNGVGYELIFKTFAEPEMLELCTPIVYGSPKIAAYHRKALDIQANFTIINDAKEAHEGKINLLPCFDDDVKVDLGMPTPESGMAALHALDKAMTDFRDGAFDVLVSCPFDENNIHDDNFNFPGFEKYVETSLGDGRKAVTVMLNQELSVAVQAAGANIKDVAAKISKESLKATVKTLEDSARRDFRIYNPRVAVLALNSSADGDEERNIIAPALDELNEDGINAFGPYAAETFFGTRQYEAFDMILAMYDDQGTVPFCTLTPDEGVTYVANLPIVCTAPMISPMFAQAGAGTADEQPFRQAIYHAIDIFRNRQTYDEPIGNPLPKLYHEKRDESEKVRFSIPKRHDAPRGQQPRDNRQKDSQPRQQPANQSAQPAAQPHNEAGNAAAPATAEA